jgi:hypothetical protein
MIPQNLTWPDVAGALILALPGIVSTVFLYYTRKLLKTGTDKPIGQIVTEASKSLTNSLVTGNDKTVGEMITEIHGEASTQATPFSTH